MKLLIIAAMVTIARAGTYGTTSQNYVSVPYQIQEEPQNYVSGPYQVQEEPQHQAYQNYAVPNPKSAEGEAKIVNWLSDRNAHAYEYAYETANGIRAHEVGDSQGGTKVQGVYSYTGDDGVNYEVKYVADEHGFRAQGAHIPTPPPVPEAILKSIEQNAADEAKGIVDDGSYQHHQSSPQAQDYHYNTYQVPAYASDEVSQSLISSHEPGYEYAYQ